MGSELVTLEDLDSAMATLEQNPGASSTSNIRLDAQHVDNCFQDGNGNLIDLGEDVGSFAMDLPDTGDVPSQNLALNPHTGAVTAVPGDSLLTTVCQSNVEEEDPDTMIDVGDFSDISPTGVKTI